MGGVLGLTSDGTNIYAVDNLANVMKLTGALVETWWVAWSSHQQMRSTTTHLRLLRIIHMSHRLLPQVL